MNKFRFFLLAAFTGLIMANGCTKDEPNDSPTPPENPEEITVNIEELAVTADSGTFRIIVTCDAEWTATSDAPEWCTVVAENDSVIAVTVSENNTDEPRTATITVAADTMTRTVTVVQASKNGTVEFTVTTSEYYKTIVFTATAKSITVDWGDESTTEEHSNLNSTSVSHTYEGETEYTVHVQAVELSYFDYRGYQLTALDLSNCSTLERLFCQHTQLSILDVSKNAALTELYCDSSWNLTNLDVSKNTALTELSCNANKLISLNANGCTVLTSLDCRENRLNTLDVSGCTALTSLDCRENQLNILDVSDNTALTSLNCYGNQLSTLDVSNNTALTELICLANQLNTLDVSKNTALTSLHCSYNQLNTLDVSKNRALIMLDCSGNQLSADALNKIFTDLPETERGYIYIGDNPGTDTCDRSIAEDKNWDVLVYD